MANHQGACMMGLARRLVILFGDPVQGSRPTRTLADGHTGTVVSAGRFRCRSFRCPDQIMKLVEPAYRAKLGNGGLRLTGVHARTRPSLCVNTDFDAGVIRQFHQKYKDHMMAIGFTKEAIETVGDIA